MVIMASNQPNHCGLGSNNYIARSNSVDIVWSYQMASIAACTAVSEVRITASAALYRQLQACHGSTLHP